jgi:hypothetical protein
MSKVVAIMLAGTPFFLGNPIVTQGVGVTHLRYPVRKAQSGPSPGGELQLGERFTRDTANDVFDKYQTLIKA